MTNGLPRVGIVSEAGYPSSATDTQQVVKNAAALARAGLPVELIIPVRWGRSWWSRQRRMRELAEFYNIQGELPIVQLHTIPSGHFQLPSRVAHCIAAPLYLWSKRFDVAYTRTPASALACLGLGKPVVFETYRRWGNESPTAAAWLARLTRHARLLGILTHSRQSAQSMIQAGFPADRVEVMHNGYDIEDMAPVLTREQARHQLGLASERPIAVYTGNMQPNKCIESIIDVAARLPRVDFLLVGGAEADIDRLQQLCTRLGAKNVTFEGSKPPPMVPPYLYAADVLLIPPTNKPLYTYGRTVLPFKLFPYLAAGRAILAPDLPDLRELLEHDGNAWLVPPDDPARASDELGRILGDPARLERIACAAGEKGRALTWDHRAERIKQWLLAKWQA